ncbi:MAG: T9SS type A sorting domain-containing protein, partial [Ignavibacteriae bacterium]|nr:T9SS type A sorting domain-containing protein [Ignavibacteriota bacterium]
YPNPFNPTTRIRFTIPSSGFTTLKVYDVLGNEVATLVNQEMNSGSHETRWNATGMASGVYFYRLATSGVVETKRMVVIR